MGFSIHYSGTIKHIDLIPDLVNEITDVCETFSWKYQSISDETLRGILFAPEECEPLFFTFNKEGNLISPVLLQFNIEPITIISVKTQFAGIDTHMSLIKLLKYLSEKYFSVFELQDEGGYWETDDEEVLRTQFKNYEAAFAFFTGALESLEARENESPESLVERMIRAIEKKTREDL